LNGFRIRPSHEVESFFWSIARGEQTVEQIREWLAKHIELFEQGTEQE
jgi:prophage maintenance system killer protein